MAWNQTIKYNVFLPQTRYLVADRLTTIVAEDAAASADPTCIPEYFPALAHRHSIEAHSANLSLRFYVVFTGMDVRRFQHKQIEPLLKNFCEARYAVVSTWTEVLQTWGLHRLTPAFACRVPPALFLMMCHPPRSLKKAKAPSTQKNKSNSSLQPFPTKSVTGGSTSQTQKLSSPTKKSPTKLSFPRPVYDAPPRSLPFPPSMLEEIRDNLWAAATRTSTAAASTATEAEAALPVLTSSSPLLTVIDLDEFSDSGSDITDLSTSHNLSGSPGQASGDLPPEYQAFGEAEQTPLVYGLSGHHVLYHSRDPAFALFQDSAAAEFLVTASVNDICEFIRRHWPQVPAPLFAVSGCPFIVRDLKQMLCLQYFQDCGPDSEMLVTTSGSEAEEFIQRHRTREF
ncbi:hypothetical protein B0H14DRAFT_3467627 [Mycena olivaceomarginata]|nr:hypothetical protein B0H14DRAFT_3467627 [Mycena olivaceomarginata]